MSTKLLPTFGPDLDEMFEAVEMLTKNDEIDILLKGVENRLTKHAEEKLGKEWVEKGLEARPYQDQSDHSSWHSFEKVC